MSEQVLQAEVSAEETAVETAAEESAAEGREEMPREERSRQAARRRAAEQKAASLREEQQEHQLREQVMNHPLVQEAMQLLEATRFRQDLERVRVAYPELSAKSPEEVGEIYCRLMASGAVDPVVAYEAQAAFNRRRETAPEDMVSAKSTGANPLYYSSGELDRLTQKDLEDPGIFRKALSSLAKLR